MLPIGNLAFPSVAVSRPGPSAISVVFLSVEKVANAARLPALATASPHLSLSDPTASGKHISRAYDSARKIVWHRRRSQWAPAFLFDKRRTQSSHCPLLHFVRCIPAGAGSLALYLCLSKNEKDVAFPELLGTAARCIYQSTYAAHLQSAPRGVAFLPCNPRRPAHASSPPFRPNYCANRLLQRISA